MAQKFDGLQYLASYPDLIEAFGADAAAGRQHYLQFGQHEGRRTDTFDEKQYLKNYHDLAVAFGQRWPCRYHALRPERIFRGPHR